jgi:hypothetical protein
MIMYISNVLETLEVYMHPPKICNFCLMHKFKQFFLALALLLLLLRTYSIHPNIITYTSKTTFPFPISWKNSKDWVIIKI